jgi:hypothetical protein
MVHIGASEITLTKRSGMFVCPVCRKRRPYVLRSVKRFLTVYFVPLIPLDEVSQHVRCQICKEQYPIEVLSGHPRVLLRQAGTPQSNRGLILAALRLLMVDGNPTPAEIREAQQLIFDRTGIRATGHEILQQRELVLGPAAPNMAEHLRAAGALSQAKREQVVRDLFLVASADGDLRPGQLAELSQLPAALGIKESRFRKLIMDVVHGPQVLLDG